MANDQDIISNKISELIPDVVELILSKLPYYYLPSCRLVCKTWNDVILSSKHDPSISPASNFLLAHVYSNRRDRLSFRNLHCLELDSDHVEEVRSVASFNLRRKYFRRSFISTINSCNGLLAFVVTKNTKSWLNSNTVVILNPMTNEYFELPKDEFKGNWLTCSYGFGFCPKTKHYKVVRNSTVEDRNSTVNYKSEIFAFGTRQEWTRIESPSYSFNGCHGVYLNGGLHWVGQDDLHHDVIYRLNMEDEKYEHIPFPNDDGYFPCIGVFNGALHLTLSMEGHEYTMWKMKEDGSWIKAFSTSVPDVSKNILSFSQSTVEQVKICKDGKILCVWAGAELVLYDPKTEKMEKLMDDTIAREFWIHNINCFNFNALSDILTGKIGKILF
ncbi:F-box protein At3g07870-like [Cucurbita pepo subsp. pepo]|uniref:F-box protein At3g07870-like n=1 Tax=Cucurbita pepo subsp. pepo TaxID=3664 RepID=UPI000C9D59D0|nr:F-box protein At3g07870-like [Cucurbita pepo subsp. pepo]